MRDLNITKADLKNQIGRLFGSWIEVDFKNLKQAFGFKRIPGLAMSLNKLMKSSNTEAELSIEPDYVIHDNIKEWCKENHIDFYFLDNAKQYRFRFSAGRDNILNTINSKIQEQTKLFHKSPRMVVLHINIARNFYDQQIMNNAACSTNVSPNGKFKILGMDVIEAINVEIDFVELIY